jgi:hypothetical protein
MLLNYNQLTQLNKKEKIKSFVKDLKFIFLLEYSTFLGKGLYLNMACPIIVYLNKKI